MSTKKLLLLDVKIRLLLRTCKQMCQNDRYKINDFIFTVDCGSSSRPSSASLNSASPAGSTSHLPMGSTSHLPLGSTSHLPTSSIRSSQSSLSLVPTYDSLRSLASRVAACHICQADNNITCMVPEFVHSVAAYLSHSPQLRAYREMLIREPHLQNLLNIRMCIQDPSRALIKGGVFGWLYYWVSFRRFTT